MKVEKGLLTSVSELAFIMKFQGTECPFLRYEDKDTNIQNLVSYSMMERDCDKAISLFEGYINNSYHDNVGSAVLHEAFISYARSFKEGKGRKIKKINAEEVFSAEDIIIHNEMINLRDKFYAHSDTNQNETVMVCIALNPDQNNKKILDMYRGMPRVVSVAPEKIKKYIEIANKNLVWLRNKNKIEIDDILSSLKACDINKLYELAISPDSIQPHVKKVFISGDYLGSEYTL